MKKVKLDMVEVQKSFDRTDKIIAFKKELTELINRNSMDVLFNLPDFVLASVAVGQMEICSMVTNGAKNGNKYHALFIS